MQRTNISIEAFSDGTTIAGTLVAIKAKFKELFVSDFSKNYDSIPNIKDILKEIVDTRIDLNNTKGDGQANISFVPIKTFSKHLLANGKLIKHPKEVLKELINIYHYVQLRNDKLLPAWNKYLKDFAKSIENNDSKDKIETNVKTLAISGFKTFSSKELIGAWLLSDVKEEPYKGVYLIEYHNYEGPKDLVSLHVKSYTRSEIEALLNICEDIVKAVGKYYFSDGSTKDLYNDEIKHLTDAALINLGRIIEHSENIEALKAGEQSYSNMYNHVFVKTIEHGIEILYTVKAVLRIIQGSIRRFN